MHLNALVTDNPSVNAWHRQSQAGKLYEGLLHVVCAHEASVPQWQA